MQPEKNQWDDLPTLRDSGVGLSYYEASDKLTEPHRRAMNSLIDDSVKLWAEYRARGMYPAADMLRRMLQAHQVTVSVQRGGAVTWRYL